MKLKNEKRRFNIRLKTYLGFKFCVFAVLLLSCSPTSLFGAEISSFLLDPTSLLAAHLPKTPRDANTTENATEISIDINTAKVPMRTVELQNAPQPRLQTAAKNVGVTFTNHAAQINQELILNSVAVPKESKNQLKRSLWQDSITVPQGQSDKSGDNELQKLIEQIRSINFKPRQSPKPIIIVESVSAVKPNEILPDTNLDKATPQKPQKREAKPQLPYQPVSEQTLQMLDTLLKHPEQLDNPLELAEILYLSGSLKEAAVFYQEALNRETADQADSAQDRAWILFQTGNCLRNHDMPTATKMYRRLITEFPKSDWVDFARTQNELVNWHQQDKPQTLIVNYRKAVSRF